MSVLSCSWWDSAVINSAVFRLHYKVTSSILFALAACIILLNWFSNTIHCISNSIPTHVVNTFCWNEDSLLQDVPRFSSAADVEKKRVTIYRWVHCILLIQAICFLIPHLLWKYFEGGLVRSITNGLRGASRNADDRVDKQSRVVKYLKRNTNQHNIYAFVYILCNALSFVNVVYHISYISHLPDSVDAPTGFDDTERNYTSNPMLKVFPRSIKCTPFQFGASGTIQIYSALCYLPYNVISEKLFYVLHIWFIFLAVCTAIYFLSLLVFAIVSPLRSLSLRSALRLTYHAHLHSWLSNLSFGDAFLLQLLGKNIDNVTLQEILDETVTGSKSGGKLSEQFESPT